MLGYSCRGPRTMRYFAVVICTVLLWSGTSSASEADSTIWEIKKTNNDKSYDPPKFAISLQEYNDLLSSAAYCMRDGVPNMFIPRLCSACTDCEWKHREGFTTEDEWRAEVTTEMARLDNEGSGGQAGVWLVGAPRSMKLDAAIIDELESSLGLSLATVAKSATSRARYFVVSGTPNEVCPGLQAAGFTTFTPVPAILKVHPSLVELGPTAGAAVGSSTAAAEDGGEGSGEEAIQDIRVALVPGKKTSRGDEEEVQGVARANALATAWSGGLVATTVGHVNARVEAGGDSSITIRDLTRLEARNVANLIATTQREVLWINPMERIVTHNKYAANVVQGGQRARVDSLSFWDDDDDFVEPTTYPLWEMGIRGEGQVIAVSDSGLDWDHCFFRDNGNNPDLSGTHVWESTTHRKIRQYSKWHKTDARESKDGHGTHVCGTLAGNEAGKESEERGVAYAAKLAFFDVGDEGKERGFIDWLLGRPNSLEVPFPYSDYLFPDGYRVGARIHSMSWGSSNGASYGTGSSDVDAYSWIHQDFIAITSAGNSGSRASTLGSPGTAKNCVAVGASENPKVYFGRKIEMLTDFSSRGPTADGRIKPDVCAPGRGVASAKSLGGSQASCGLSLQSGTSMAAPVISGVAALVRQYFVQGYYPDGKKNPSRGFVPMGALLKAVLVNSAQRMVGTEATRQGNRHPSMDYGFGLAVIDETLTTNTSPSARGLYVDGAWKPSCNGCPRVEAGEESGWIYRVKMSQNARGIPLKMTLVWSDFPGMVNTNDPTVNDLDLTVENWHGRILRCANGRNSQDRLNNVEHIELPSPVAGATYNVRVHGADVFRGPQPYAVVISGPFANYSVKKIQANGHRPRVEDQPAEEDKMLFGVNAVVVITVAAVATLLAVVVGVVVYRRRSCGGSADGGALLA